MKYKPFYMILIFSVLLDQAAKYIVSTYIALGSGFQLVNGSFFVIYVRNTGAAFGILQGNNTFLIAVSSLFIILLIFYVFRYIKGDVFLQTSAALIAGGAVGNFIDRVFRGYVVDFFDLKYFSVFNTADIMINVGVALLMIDILFRGDRKKRH